MLTSYTIPENYPEELASFSQALEDFKEKRLDPVLFKAHRVGFGVYEQRTDNTFMVRIRTAGGVITPRQMAGVARLSQQYGAPHIHVTTRFEVQLHDVAFDHIYPVVSGLTKLGLSSRGGGGNTIRNITASVTSGVDPDEVFDVAPYAIALTTRMIAEPDSYNLPRKVKIAFSNSEKDTAFATLADLGFIAVIQDGKKGFRVFVAGGMGAKSRVAKLLHDFIPEDRVYHATRAIKQMFDKHGNRRNKFQNRLRFLWDQLGGELFQQYYLEELEAVVAQNPPPLVLPPLENTGRDPGTAPQTAPGDGFDRWRTRYVSPQKQEGLVAAVVPLALGDISSQDALALAEFLELYGENTLRFSKEQNIHIRNIPQTHLGNLFNAVRGLSTHSDRPPVVGNMIACTGAATCKLGICLPRGLASAIDRRLADSPLALDEVNGFRLNISGCPNSCGQHNAADLGFFGKVSRVDGRMMPAYNIMAGAVIDGQGAQLAQKLEEVAAKDVPDFVHDVLADWLIRKSALPTFSGYLKNGGRETIRELAARYNGKLLSLAQNPAYFTDWGTDQPFSLAERGMGECSAGLFDMIDVDSKTLKEQIRLLRAGGPADSGPADSGSANTRVADGLATLKGVVDGLTTLQGVAAAMRASARMLLITRGLEPVTDKEIYRLFRQHFIEAGLVPQHFAGLVDLAGEGRFEELMPQKEVVADLAQWMLNLYKEMDQSLRFPAEKLAANHA
ncbi:MAG: nitrite/sulfite reductase [Deltaproteobacteria bacterium]|nr:nitrite/sulfite reductase [Deltaproteobacteria bacterium]